jgi:hypothetical protein
MDSTRRQQYEKLNRSLAVGTTLHIDTMSAIGRNYELMLPPYSSPRPSRNKPPGPLMAPAALVRPAAS